MPIETRQLMPITIIMEHGEIQEKYVYIDTLPSNYLLYVEKGRVYMYDDGKRNNLISYNTFKKIKKTLVPEENFKFIKILFAWIVMYFACFLTVFTGSIIYRICIYVFNNMLHHSGVIDLSKIFSNTAYALVFMIFPLVYGAVYSIKICDMIYKSKKRKRYIIFGIYMIISRIISIVYDAGLQNYKYIPVAAIAIVFAVILIICSTNERIMRRFQDE